MVKFFLSFQLFILLSVLSYSQDISVLDKFSNFGLSGVMVYALNSTDTLQTNSDGEVNIDIFPNDATIVFSQLYFKKGRYSKEELLKLHNVVYLDRGDALNKLSSTSPLKSKQYSADLPFFIDIVDLDEESSLDEGESDRITFTNNEGGMSVFRGLESGKMLLVLDGMRLNNAIHRNGKVERLMDFNNTMTQKSSQILRTSFNIYGPEPTGGSCSNILLQYPPVSSKLIHFILKN